MKKSILGLATIFLLGSIVISAKNETEKFHVKGQCEMCEKRIEKAATSIEGVEMAVWDKETQNLEISYDEKKTNSKQIQTSVAMAGHDTELFNANDKKYADLPGCCHYQRDEIKTLMNHKGTTGSNHGKATECSEDKTAPAGSCCESK